MNEGSPLEEYIGRFVMSAEAINCGSCPVAAFYDQDVNNLLDIDGVEETAIYGASIGKKEE